MPAKTGTKIVVLDEDSGPDGQAAAARPEAAGQEPPKAARKAPARKAPAKRAAPARKAPAKKPAPAQPEPAPAGAIDRLLEEEAPAAQPAAQPAGDDKLAERQSAVKAVIADIQKKEEAADGAPAKPAAAPTSAPAAASAPAVPHLRRSVKLYRNIAVSFIVFTLAVLSVIFYFAFAKATITLVPNQERVTNSLIFEVVDGDGGGAVTANSVRGVVRSIKVTAREEYQATGKDVIGKEAVGSVTIINNYTRNQPLVATTRLLAADGQLFRLKDTVNVPAGGQVQAEIYADQPVPESAIGPTKFTIPGLWAGIQDKVFAESKEAVVYREKAKSRIVQEDLDNAVRDIKQRLLVAAKEEVRANFGEYGDPIFKIDESALASRIDGKVGDETESFPAEMEAEVVVVAFDKPAAAQLQRSRLTASLGDTRELVSFNADQTIYALDAYDLEDGAGTINATFEGQVSLRENAKVVDVDKVLGLSDEQLRSYLSGLNEIAGFEVSYFPSFIKRVPRLTDRVEVVIRK